MEFGSQGREMRFFLNHQHGRRDVTYKPAILDNFSWRHEKLSSIVWTTIRYVVIHFRNRRGAAPLRHRNCVATTFFLCVWKEAKSFSFKIHKHKVPKED